MLYKKDTVAVPRKQMAMRSSQDESLTLEDVLEETADLAGTLYRKSIIRKVQKRVMASRCSDV